MNNVAELIALQLDSESDIQNHWYDLVEKAKSDNFVWTYRNYQPVSFFTPYFRNLINDVLSIIEVKHKNVLIQLHDKNARQFNFEDPKDHLNTVHRDAARLSCITIPLLCSALEPVYFYKDGSEPKIRGGTPLNKPIQVHHYSKKHPTLVNVNNLHSVRVVDDDAPRVLLQISFAQPFDDIVAHKPSIWKLL